MLTKLALKNAGKSIREYAVYFFTLVLGVCVFYMFNSIHAQQAMLNLNSVQSEAIKAVMDIMSYVSVFVAVILGFLIVYANNFFIKRRKKELGIYMTLGMGKGRISAILILETSVIAIFALVVGLLVGIFGSQFMSVFTARLFEVSMSRYTFVFSIDAAIKTAIYFGCAFIVVIMFNTMVIGRFKLIDLIYGGRKNEALKMRNTKVAAVLFLISIGILARAYYLIITTGMLNIGRDFTMSIVLGAIGTLLFFYSLSSLITVLVQHNKRLYYRDLNMFVVRQLGSKINTNCVSISVVCIALLFTIGIFSTGYSMNSLISQGMDEYQGFDYIFVYHHDIVDYENEMQKREKRPEAFSNLMPYIESNEYIKEYGKYDYYYPELTLDEAGVIYGDEYNIGQNGIYVMSLSDYNNIQSKQGKEPVVLENDQYVFAVSFSIMQEAAENTVNAGVVINVNGHELKPLKAVLDGNVSMFTLIVNDKVIEGLQKYESIFYANCVDNEANIAFGEQIDKAFKDKDYVERTYDYLDSRLAQYANIVASKAMISFIAIYIGFVFMMTSAAVLAIQQLSETADNRHRYDLLRKLGADKKMLNKALFTQILCYFLAPLSLAVVHSIFGLKAVVMTLYDNNKINISGPVTMAAIFVGVLYLAYFIMTYSGSKAVIYKK